MIKELYQKYKALSLPLKCTFWYAMCNFLQRGISVITTPVFTRILPQEQYGIASTYVAWSDILILVTTLSLHKSMMNVFKTKQDYGRVLSVITSLSIIITSIFALLAFVYQDRVISFLGLSKALSLALFLSFIPNAIINCWSTKKRYEYKYIESVAVSAIIICSNLISAIVVIMFSKTAEGKILPSIITSYAVSIPILCSIYKNNCVVYDREIWRFSIGFSVPLLPHYLSEFVLRSSDKLMINSMCGSRDVAIYSIGYSIASLITMVTSAINSSFIPYRYKELNDQRYASLSKNTSKIILFVAIILFILMMFGPEIVIIFGGRNYKESQQLVVPICLGVFFNYLFQIFAGVEEYYEEKKYIVIASVMCALLNIGLNYIFIGIYGYVAASYTTFISYASFCFLHYLFYRRICSKHINGIQIYNTKQVLIISILVIVSGYIAYILYRHTIIKYMILLTFILICIKNRKAIKKICSEI